MFNSSKQINKKFNARRANAGQNLSPRESGLFAPQPITTLYAADGSGNSVLSCDPDYKSRDELHGRMVEHYLGGCAAEPVATDGNGNHQRNDDGTVARKCSCGGKWQGFQRFSDVPEEARRILGIGVRKGKVHYAGDGCRDSNHHQGTSALRETDTAADYAMLPVNIPGIRGKLRVMDLLANPLHSSFALGQTKDGQMILPGSYQTDSNGRLRHTDMRVLNSMAQYGALTGMTNLVKKGVVDLGAYFDVAKATAHQYFGVKRPELGLDGNPDEYVSLQTPYGYRQPELHTAANGTFRTIHRALSSIPGMGLDYARLETMHPGEAKEMKKRWDRMATSSFTQTFNPFHVFRHQTNPLYQLIDTQEANRAATSKIPGLRESYFAAMHGHIPIIGRNMAEFGNIGKRDPYFSFWQSTDALNWIHHLVDVHAKDYDWKAVPGRKVFQDVSIEDMPKIDMDLATRRIEPFEEF